MSSLIVLGKLAADDEKNDAVHIAVAPVIAAENLFPGQHIGLNDKGEACPSRSPIGVVDVFLSHQVMKGQKFFLMLYPNTIKSLRHDWEHPAFQEKNSNIAEAKRWLENFAAEAQLSYEELLDGARNWIEGYDYLCDGEKWEGFYTPDEFWDYYEAATGTLVPYDRRGNFFSCSC